MNMSLWPRFFGPPCMWVKGTMNYMVPRSLLKEGAF